MDLLKRMEFFRSSFFVFVAFVVLASVSNCESSAEYKVVDTNDGQVRGARKTTLIKQVDYFSFRGIPYAKSPTGELRFKAPEPVEPWKPTVLEALEHGSTCVRPNEFGGDSLPQSEDCLFVNIYTPADVKHDEKLAVLVFIHGGAFSEGSGNDAFFGPDFLIEKRVILVTFNYRLGVFGFLSLDSPEYSGNMALKDQQLALKWIHSNIAHFSGDNQRITVFGESAGGTLAHFQMLSSESRRYFRNAVLLSGTAENFWALSEHNDHSDLAYKMAKDLGEPKISLNGLVEFLKMVPAEKIVGYGTILPYFNFRTARLVVAPVIERKDAIRPFITDLPSKIYDESDVDVDVMFSLCSDEYMLFYDKQFNEVYDYDGLNKNFTLRLPFWDVNVDYDSPQYKEIMKRIRAFYFGDAAIDKNALKKYIGLLSDINFNYLTQRVALQHAKKTKSKAFYYRFSIDSRLNLVKLLNPEVKEISGTAHADDLCYIFRCGHMQSFYDEFLKNKDDEHSVISLRAIENITKLLTNFAKYGEPSHGGDPVAEFLPIQGDKVNFVDVTNDGLKSGVNPNQASYKLWSQIEKEIRQISSDASKTMRDEL